jgi:hypothetical protein
MCRYFVMDISLAMSFLEKRGTDPTDLSKHIIDFFEPIPKYGAAGDLVRDVTLVLGNCHDTEFENIKLGENEASVTIDCAYPEKFKQATSFMGGEARPGVTVDYFCRYFCQWFFGEWGRRAGLDCSIQKGQKCLAQVKKR